MDPRSKADLAPATIAAHGVRAPSPESLPERSRGAPSGEPLYLTSVFDFPSVEASEPSLAGEEGYVYARNGLPNARSLELAVAALEKAQDALATSTGMAAISCALLATLRPGDHILYQNDAYGGTSTLLRTDFARLNLEAVAVDVYNLETLGPALDSQPRALLVETLSNPLVKPVEVKALAALCHQRGVLLIVDNTFATPILARPIVAGADLVVHSATKFLGGHHDLCAGVLCGRSDIIGEARGVARRFGMTASAMDAWLTCRGLKTLAIRMVCAQEHARALTAKLRADPRVRIVHYPSWGAVLAFDLGDSVSARKFVEALELVTLTPSLGGTATTASHSASSSHRGLDPEERASLGIGDGLIRLSVGIDAMQDIWADIDQALAVSRG